MIHRAMSHFASLGLVAFIAVSGFSCAPAHLESGARVTFRVQGDPHPDTVQINVFEDTTCDQQRVDAKEERLTRENNILQTRLPAGQRLSLQFSGSYEHGQRYTCTVNNSFIPREDAEYEIVYRFYSSGCSVRLVRIVSDGLNKKATVPDTTVLRGESCPMI